MEITYLGLSAFKLKGAKVTVVTDPYGDEVGWKLARLSADIVTVSHEHFDHNNVAAVKGTKERPKPLVIRAPGEYEASGVSVYGYSSFHDKNQGEERGKNVMYTIYIDEVRVAHLGDLGHELTEKQVEQLNSVDVLLIPVGGGYTIGAQEATRVIGEIQPGIVVPMHYKLKGLAETFDQLAEIEEFLKQVGVEARREEKLVVNKGALPEQTEYVVLNNYHG